VWEVLQVCQTLSKMSFLQIIYEDESSDEKSNLTSMLLDESAVIGTGEMDAGLNIHSISESNSLGETDNNKNISTPKYEDALATNNNIMGIEWSNRETNYLLKKYNKYILATGPRKKFRTKRELFQRIAHDMKNDLKINRSGCQCENRYKTVLRKWRKQSEKEFHPKKQAVNPINIPSTSTNKFFSHKPEESEDITNLEEPNSEHRKKDLVDVLWEIFKRKEESRERRHREKMKLIKDLIDLYR
jgi:hypothetical protein